jgi:hypothetical protein
MKTNTKKTEKTCWACQRILVEKNKLGLCPVCLNKGGSTAAGVGFACLAVIVKNTPKIAKSVIKAVKNIKL